jgi:hypothetical protein
MWHYRLELLTTTILPSVLLCPFQVLDLPEIVHRFYPLLLGLIDHHDDLPSALMTGGAQVAADIRSTTKHVPTSSTCLPNDFTAPARSPTSTQPSPALCPTTKRSLAS